MKKLLIFFLFVASALSWGQGGEGTLLRYGIVLPSGAKLGSVFSLTGGNPASIMYMCAHSPTCTTNSHWVAQGAIFPNALPLQWIDFGGVPRAVLSMDVSNNVVIQGHPTQKTINLQAVPGTTMVQITATGVIVYGTLSWQGVDYRSSSAPGTPLGAPALGLSAWGISNDGNYYDCNNTLDTTATGTCLRRVTTIGKATIAGPTSAISAGTCATTIVTALAGVNTNTRFIATPAASPNAAVYSGLKVAFYPTTGNINLEVCNPTAGSITPTALNWLVTAVAF